MANHSEQDIAYQILGVAPGTPIKQIQKTYLDLLDTWKPEAIDREASPGLYEMAQAKQQEITAAYQLIADQLTPAPRDGDETIQPRGETQLQTEDASTFLEESEPLDASEPGDVPEETPVHESTGISLGAPSSDAEMHSQGRDGAEPALAPTEMEAAGARSVPATRLGGAAAVFSLLRWDKPAGRLILMLPALWAAFLAADGAWPGWGNVWIIILGSIATSAVGCAVNDLWDQDIDPLVERTQGRPLAAGTMSREMAIIVAVVAGLLSIGIAALLQPLSWVLCALAGVVILLYPAAKRVFPVPQLVLAIAWGFAVLIGWSVVSQTTLPAAAWILWLATVLWTLGFDTVYAMADQEDDRRIGINSSALFFGDRSPQAVGLFFVGTALMLLWLGLTQTLTVWYWISLCLVTLGWLNQYRRLDSHRLRPTSQIYGQIFSGNVGLGILLLLGIIFGRGTF